MIDRHEISEISEYNVDEYRRFDDEGPVVQREGGDCLCLFRSLSSLYLSLISEVCTRRTRRRRASAAAVVIQIADSQDGGLVCGLTTLVVHCPNRP